MSIIENIVPKQIKGARTGATSRKKAPSIRLAMKQFQSARQRLLDINSWYELCGKKGAEFQLTDQNGNPLYGTEPQVGHLIRIKLPAPPNGSGDGYDWVRIEKFESSTSEENSQELYGFRVRPVSNPKERSGESAHFYTSDATSTFLVLRQGETLYAIERGRNEKPNPAGGFFNKLRNILVAIGAMLGFAKPQWKMLTSGILRPRTGYRS